MRPNSFFVPHPKEDNDLDQSRHEVVGDEVDSPSISSPRILNRLSFTKQGTTRGVMATEDNLFGDANVQRLHVKSVRADPRLAAPFGCLTRKVIGRLVAFLH